MVASEFMHTLFLYFYRKNLVYIYYICNIYLYILLIMCVCELFSDSTNWLYAYKDTTVVIINSIVSFSLIIVI